MLGGDASVSITGSLQQLLDASVVSNQILGTISSNDALIIKEPDTNHGLYIYGSNTLPNKSVWIGVDGDSTTAPLSAIGYDSGQLTIRGLQEVTSSNHILAYNSGYISYISSSIFATTGSNTFRGNQTVSGSIIPGGPYTNNTSSYDLGSATAAWRDLYVSNGSIKMISGSSTATIQYTSGSIVFTGGPVTLPSNSTSPTASLALTASTADNFTVRGNLTASIISATDNGNGTNFKVGDDIWLGDINTADTLGLKGQFDATKGYIKFGSGSSNPILGSGGTNTLQLTGSLGLASGSLTITTGSITMPNRPAFSVYGSGTTNNLTTTQNGDGTLNSNNFTVTYSQGSGFDSSTGIFTAPVAGLYQVTLIGRNSGFAGGISQLVVLKNNSTAGGNVLMIEWASSSTMNHAGGSQIFKLAVNDTLRLKVTAGQINFDGNDNWSVAYIG
jgi:hypothetical protein